MIFQNHSQRKVKRQFHDYLTVLTSMTWAGLFWTFTLNVRNFATYCIYNITYRYVYMYVIYNITYRSHHPSLEVVHHIAFLPGKVIEILYHFIEFQRVEITPIETLVYQLSSTQNNFHANSCLRLTSHRCTIMAWKIDLLEVLVSEIVSEDCCIRSASPPVVWSAMKNVSATSLLIRR